MTLIEVYDLQRWKMVATAKADPAITSTKLDVDLVGNTADQVWDLREKAAIRCAGRVWAIREMHRYDGGQVRVEAVDFEIELRRHFDTTFGPTQRSVWVVEQTGPPYNTRLKIHRTLLSEAPTNASIHTTFAAACQAAAILVDGFAKIPR